MTTYGPWRYDEEELWICRDEIGSDDGFGEIFCHFRDEPSPDRLQAMLDWLNSIEML